MCGVLTIVCVFNILGVCGGVQNFCTLPRVCVCNISSVWGGPEFLHTAKSVCFQLLDLRGGVQNFCRMTIVYVSNIWSAFLGGRGQKFWRTTLNYHTAANFNQQHKQAFCSPAATWWISSSWHWNSLQGSTPPGVWPLWYEFHRWHQQPQETHIFHGNNLHILSVVQQKAIERNGATSVENKGQANCPHNHGSMNAWLQISHWAAHISPDVQWSAAASKCDLADESLVSLSLQMCRQSPSHNATCFCTNNYTNRYLHKPDLSAKNGPMVSTRRCAVVGDILKNSLHWELVYWTKLSTKPFCFGTLSLHLHTETHQNSRLSWLYAEHRSRSNSTNSTHKPPKSLQYSC